MKNLLCAFALIAISVGCIEEETFLSTYSRENPAKITFSLEAGSSVLPIVTDSIESKLMPRLELFSKERGDFVLQQSSHNADYVLTLSISEFCTINRQIQNKEKKKRQDIEQDYDDIFAKTNKPKEEFDSSSMTHVKRTIVSTSFGVKAVIEVDPRETGPRLSEEDQAKVAATMKDCHLCYKATLKTGDGKEVWHYADKEKLKLNYVIPEAEQLNILTRNVVLSLEDNIPLLSIPEEPTKGALFFRSLVSKIKIKKKKN